jgi:hypothetical protein
MAFGGSLAAFVDFLINATIRQTRNKGLTASMEILFRHLDSAGMVNLVFRQAESQDDRGTAVRINRELAAKIAAAFVRRKIHRQPKSCVIAGQLSPAGVQAGFRWISLNTDALVAYWEQIDTAELCQMLKPLTDQQTNALTSGCLRRDRPHQQRGSL